MSRDHGNNRFDVFGTELVKLYNDRYRIVVRVDISNFQEDWYESNKANFWKQFGSQYGDEITVDGSSVGWTPDDGEEYDNMYLVATEMKYLGGGKVEPILEFIYETLTTGWVQDREDVESSPANGLRGLVRTEVSLPDSASPYSEEDIGVRTILNNGKNLYLSSFEDTSGANDQTQIGRVTSTWAEAGLISTSQRSGPANIPNTTFVTYESVGVVQTPTGILTESRDVNVDGFKTFIRTALQGTVEGTKLTYKDVVDVRDAGTVNLTEVSKSVGGISGTIAVSQVTPPRTKTLAATVTVEITTTPPDTVDIAYDLGNISCSVTAISMSENYRGSDVFETASGNSRFSGQRKTADMSARISSYPECYLSGGTSSSGTFSYTSSYENASTNPDAILAIAQTSTTNTFMDGTGSTSADYDTTGVIKRSSRPVFTAIDGTVYYEVITWTV